MQTHFKERLSDELRKINDAGLTKNERIIVSPQAPTVTVKLSNGEEKSALNLCANNYLGLADHPDIAMAARDALEDYGFGAASVRFICGTTQLHRELETAIADYLGTDDSILFAACFDANGGVFEPLLGSEDAIVSDSLNHASIIDGIRLCKAKRYRFQNRDLQDLEDQIRKARTDGARDILIVTDGVFSMDGYLADLPTMREVADRYGAIVMVDDCHATGFIGPEGAGTHAHYGLKGKIDILSGTLGKALGGGMGGYIASSQPVIDLLRQRARPYLFSNTLAPMLAAGGLKAIELARQGDDLRSRLGANAKLFREGLTSSGFDLLPGEHPIIPVMIGDGAKAASFAEALMDEGVYVTAFSFPVVPRGEARIRTQMCASHTTPQIDDAIAAFRRAASRVGVHA